MYSILSHIPSVTQLPSHEDAKTPAMRRVFCVSIIIWQQPLLLPSWLLLPLSSLRLPS